MIHKLKTIQPYFDDIVSGKKTFEVRKDDRNFKVGDRLDLFEGDASLEYLHGRNHIHRYISYKLNGGNFGIEEGYCVLGLSIDEIK